jgi:hypothetical protein
MHTARVLANKSPSLFQTENSVTTVGNHDNRMTSSVFTVQSSDVLPPRSIVTKAFYESLKPYIVVMRAIGVCPLFVDNKGNDVYTDPATWSKIMEMKRLYCVMFEGKWFHIYRQVALRYR